MYLNFELWPWGITLTCQHSIHAAPWDAHAWHIVSILTYSKVVANVKVSDLTYTFRLWAWRVTMTMTCQPLKMCSFIRYTCIHAKYQVPISTSSKVIVNVKVWRKPTNIKQYATDHRDLSQLYNYFDWSISC